MKPDTATHKPRAVDPQTFRAAATGVGQAFSESVRTGTNRAQDVINSAPAASRAAIPEAEGYPPRTMDDAGNYLPPIMSPVQLKRAGR